MSYTKNKTPLETLTSADGVTLIRYRRRHSPTCQSHCTCCAGDWDCSCGAVELRWPCGCRTGRDCDAHC